MSSSHFLSQRLGFNTVPVAVDSGCGVPSLPAAEPLPSLQAALGPRPAAGEPLRAAGARRPGLAGAGG